MQPSLILTPFAKNAGSGFINPIADSRQSGDLPQKANWSEGFPGVTMTPLAAGGVPPEGQDFNGVLNALSTHTIYKGVGGQYAWSATYVAANGGYPKGALIARSDYSGYWQCTVDNNTTNPDTGGAGWIPLSGRGTEFAIDTGTANTYVCAFTPAITARSEGQVLRFKASATNTGVSTFNDGISAAPLVGGAHSPLQGGEIVANGDAWIQWNSSIGGGSYILLFCTGAAEQVGTATKTQQAATLGQVQSGGSITALDTGFANAYVCSFVPAISARSEQQVLRFKVKTANTGASTFNDGLGVVALVGGAHSALQGGELVVNGDAWVQWNTSVGGGSYILLFCTGAAEQVAPATQSQHSMQLGQATGRLLRTTVYTISSSTQQVSIDGGALTSAGATTFTTQPLMSKYTYRILGGGGAGGGAQGTAAGQQSVGGGGGAGGYSEGIGTAALSGVTITVGTAGVPGVAGLAPGGSGGTSTIATVALASGGIGGSAGPGLSSLPSVTSGGVAGIGSGGSLINTRGVAGGIGLNAALTNVASGNGGASIFGGGGQAVGGTGFGSASNTIGAGGSGGVCFASVAGGAAGGAGGVGYIEFKEYA